MHWTTLSTEEISRLKLPSNGYSYLKLRKDERQELYPSGQRYAQIAENLKKHYRQFGGAVLIKANDQDNRQVWCYRVLTQGIKELGVPAIMGMQFENQEKVDELITKVKIKMNQLVKPIVEYYRGISHTPADHTEFDCNKLAKRGKTLSQLQLDAINQILTYDEIGIFAEPGSGKTLIGCVAIKYLIQNYGEEVLIIAPKGKPVSQWKRDLEIEEMDDITTVVHYEAIKSLFNYRGEGKDTKKHIVKNPKSKYSYLWDKNFKVVILDEAQKVKNPESDTHRMVKEFIRLKAIKHRIPMSGTPAHDKMRDTLGILKCTTSHPIGELSMDEYDALNLISPAGRMNGKDLYKELTKKTIWFRTLEQYGISLPKLNFIPVAIQPDEEYMREYYRILKESKTISIQKGVKSIDIDTAKINLRIWSAAWRQGWLIDYLNQATKPVTVMSEWNEKVLYPVAKALNLPVLDGAKKDSQRDQLVDDFLTGKTPHLLAQIKVAGAGLDGIQEVCDTLVLANPLWSPGDLAQVIGRIRRMGGPAVANIVVPYVPSQPNNPDFVSVEESMIQTLRNKYEQIKEYLHGDDMAEDEVGDFLSSVETSLAQKLRLAIMNS